MFNIRINVHKTGDQLLTLEISNQSFVKIKLKVNYNNGLTNECMSKLVFQHLKFYNCI